jgi:hypothetical protein
LIYTLFFLFIFLFSLISRLNREIQKLRTNKSRAAAFGHGGGGGAGRRRTGGGG